MKVISNIRVGRAQTTPSMPSHTPGVREGNAPGSGGIDRNPGLHATGETGAGRATGKSTARRSTGVNPKSKNPIDPRMPNLTPA